MFQGAGQKTLIQRHKFCMDLGIRPSKSLLISAWIHFSEVKILLDMKPDVLPMFKHVEMLVYICVELTQIMFKQE